MSHSACAIKFYLAESANKRGLWRLSMGSNWSILHEWSYFSPGSFFPLPPHTHRRSLDRNPRRIFLLEMWLSKQNISANLIHYQVSDTARWICSSPVCSSVGDTQKQWAFWQLEKPFHARSRQRKECVDPNDVQSSLSRRAGRSPGQKSTDSSKCC